MFKHSTSGMYQKTLSIVLTLSVLLAIGAPALNLSTFKSPTALASATIGSPPITSLTQGLVGYWTLDGQHTNWATGKTFDQSGRGNTGTMTSMTSSTAPVAGKIGQAFKFDGVNDSVVSTVGIISSNSEVTISAWFKTTTVAAGERDIFSAAGASFGVKEDYTLAINVTAGKLSARWAIAEIATGATALRANTWYHAVMVRSGSSGNWTATLYLNGVLEGRGTTATDPTYGITGNQAAIGKLGSNSQKFFSGSIDDVRLYNRVLSATEVAKLYQLGTAKFANSPVTSMTSGLVGYWTLDGQHTNWATGKTFDQSGNGKTGTMTNMTTSTTPVVGKLGQAFKFDGVNDYVSAGSVASSIKTVSFWVKANDTTKKIMDLNGTATIEAISGVITANNFTIPTIYVNGAVSGGQGTEIFTTTGAGTWTAPSGSISVFAETWAGGGGGGLPGLGSNKSGGGGAGGGYSAVATSVTPGTTYDLYVGAGGAITGSAGEDSWFSNSSVVLSKGGGEGGTGPSGAGGTAGTGAIGTTLYSGGDGAAGVDASYSGGGGGGAGSAGNGGVAVTSTAGSGGSPDGGIGGAGRTTNGSGNTGSTLGGGGSGAMKGDSGFMLGGAGGQGQVKLTYTVSGPAISPGVWYHVVITTPTAINGSAVDIGRVSAGYFAGQIDDVRIYNRALSARDAQTLYQLGTAKFANSPVTSLTQGLVGYWTLDGQHTNWATGKTFDQSGNGKTGTMTNMTTSTAPTVGKFGQALKFDGTNDYLSAGNVFNSVKSVSFWTKANNVTQKILDLNGTATVEVISGTITANSFTSPTIYVDGRVGSTINTQWRHVVITTDTGINASAVDIGRVSTGYFAGQIDDVRIYNKALSPREIQTLYNLGR